jgi:hypothetical protein
VSLRRSIPALIVFRVILAYGAPPADAMTWMKIFSRCHFVAGNSFAHA